MEPIQGDRPGVIKIERTSDSLNEPPRQGEAFQNGQPQNDDISLLAFELGQD